MGNVYPGHTGYTDIDMMEYKCYILHIFTHETAQLLRSDTFIAAEDKANKRKLRNDLNYVLK